MGDGSGLTGVGVTNSYSAKATIGLSASCGGPVKGTTSVDEISWARSGPNSSTQLGDGRWNNNATLANQISVYAYDSTHIAFQRNNSGDVINNAVGVGSANWRLTFGAIMPISGW